MKPVLQVLNYSKYSLEYKKKKCPLYAKAGNRGAEKEMYGLCEKWHGGLMMTECIDGRRRLIAETPDNLE